MSALKPCLDCGTLSDKARCPTHRSAREAARDRRRKPSRLGRYGKQHQEERAAWVDRFSAGAVIYCRRGINCLFHPNTRLWPEDLWDLGHPDELCGKPTAPEHRRCNRHFAGRLS